MGSAVNLSNSIFNRKLSPDQLTAVDKNGVFALLWSAFMYIEASKATSRICLVFIRFQ